MVFKNVEMNEVIFKIFYLTKSLCCYFVLFRINPNNKILKSCVLKLPSKSLVFIDLV